MYMLSVSASRIISISNCWSFADCIKWAIFVLIFFAVFWTNGIMWSNNDYFNLHQKLYLIICWCIVIGLFIIACVPYSTNVNSSSSFKYPYIIHDKVIHTHSTYAPSTIARRYHNTNMLYHQTLNQYKYNKKVLERHHSGVLNTKYTHSYYQYHLNNDNIRATKLNYKLNNYAEYLNSIPARDVKYPSWWMYIV